MSDPSEPKNDFAPLHAYETIPTGDREPEGSRWWIVLFPIAAIVIAIGFVVVLAVFGEFWFFLSIFVLLGLAIVGAAWAAVSGLL